jgi:ABC-2 type transport system ATP-binding protein
MTRTVFENAIEAHGLVKNYGDVTALDGLDLEVEAGTVFGLLGPNGAGKSTTVRILTTLSRPKMGADREATGRENLVLQGELYSIPGLKARVDEALERFDLPGDRLVKTYSGGMQRRLDVALGLLHRPQVLFLDEPTTGLDPEARAQMWEEISRLAREERMTILLTTHYLEEADRLASRLAIVDRGRIVARGTPDELKSELEGDTIHVELVEPDGLAREALARVDGLGDVALDGRTLRARSRDGGAAVPAVLAALEAQGVRAASVTVARPSLDDVYLRYAGRAFEMAP